MSDDKLKLLTFSELDPAEQRIRLMSTPSLPDPMSEAFDVSEKDREGHLINASQWRQHGAWRHRQFDQEVQLRNPALHWLALDLTRAETEDLFAALADVLGRPAPVPFKVSRWERVKQWWLRSVWRRRHYAELQAAREAIVDEYTRKGPWAS